MAKDAAEKEDVQKLQQGQRLSNRKGIEWNSHWVDMRDIFGGTTNQTQQSILNSNLFNSDVQTSRCVEYLQKL